MENISSATIIVVEDDAAVRTLIAGLLRRSHFDVLEAETAAQLSTLTAENEVDLILLDVGLPDGDGFDIVRNLTEKQDTPVIMVTGQDTPMDRVLGLEFGADDYICKPFEPRELLARVKNVLRRTQPVRVEAVNSGSEVLAFADFELNLTERRLISREHGEIPLTSGEYDLLRVLAESANRPLTRDQLLDRTRSRDWTPFDRSIDVLIGRLRAKVEADRRSPKIIKTVRSAGYVLAMPVRRIHREGKAVADDRDAGSRVAI